MAKKAAEPKKTRSWGGDEARNAAEFFTKQTNDAIAKNVDSFIGAKSEKICIGIPLGAFSLRYLYGSDSYLLGRVELIIGESGCCKTAFMFEQMRWFMMMPGGGACYELNEPRDPGDLRRSIIDGQMLDTSFNLHGPHQSVEDWQRSITGTMHALENMYKERGGCAFPIYLGLDSLAGTTNERTISNIDETGCAALTFGHDALLFKQYFQYLPPKLARWPISWSCTNHIKFKTNKYGHPVVTIPGGDHLRYAASYITYMKRGKDITRQSVSGGYEINMEMIKVQGQKRELTVEFAWSFEGTQQRSWWDWDSASIQLLMKPPAQSAEAVHDLISFDARVSHRTTTCKKLGIGRQAPYHEVGRALMDPQNSALLGALQSALGIKTRKAYQPGLIYSEQITQALAEGAVEVEDAAIDPSVRIEGEQE